MNKYFKTLSHVGIYTSDLETSLKWYTEVLGLEVAFRLERNGKIVLVYLHVTPNTFVELFAPKAEKMPPPHIHFSIEVRDIEVAVEEFKKRASYDSYKRPDIITGRDGSRIFNLLDPDGNRIEFQQFPETSKEAQAIRRATEKSI